MNVLQKHRTLATLIVLIVAGLVLFSPVFHFGFLSDDWDLIYHADRYDSFADRLTLNDHQGMERYSYRPVVGMYLGVLKSLFGLNPIGYHVFFILIHILNAILIYFLTRRLLSLCHSRGSGNPEIKNKQKQSVIASERSEVWRSHSDALNEIASQKPRNDVVSLVVGLLFLTLPAHAEAVFWISSGADLVATMFYLLSLLLFIKYIFICHPEFNPRLGKEKQTKIERHRERSHNEHSDLAHVSEPEIASQRPRNDNSYYFGFLDSLPRRQAGRSKSEMTRVFYLLSILFFVLGLLTKEIVVTLPIVFFVLLLFNLPTKIAGIKGGYEFQDNHNSPNLSYLKRGIIPIITPFIIILCFYLLFRLNATGTLFGYYGRPAVGIEVGNWIKMAADMLSSFFAWGSVRLRFAEIFREQFHWLVVLLAFVVLYVKRFYKDSVKVFLMFLAFLVISVLPVLPLGFKPLSDEGERYGYLPSVFFIILFVIFIISTCSSHSNKISDRIKCSNMSYVVHSLIGLICFVYFGYGLRYKMDTWNKYQDSNYKILNQLYQLNDGKKIMILGLPDLNKGVQAFRNGIEEAYRMYYGEEIEIVRIPVYTIDGGRVNHVLKITNYQLPITNYIFSDGFDESTQNQLFLKTKDKSLRLTGEKEYEDELVEVDFFRWHYDINRADGVTLRLKNSILEGIQNGEVTLILFDGTRLVRIL